MRFLGNASGAREGQSPSRACHERCAVRYCPYRLVPVYGIVADDMAAADLAIWNATPDRPAVDEPTVREQPLAA
jgi:hypothetical protein